jgi:hypothetical protein
MLLPMYCASLFDTRILPRWRDLLLPSSASALTDLAGKLHDGAC